MVVVIIVVRWRATTPLVRLVRLVRR